MTDSPSPVPGPSSSLDETRSTGVNGPDSHQSDQSGEANARGERGSPAGDPSALGRYRILSRLGDGGFGIVYRGYDEELRREVAIKVPHRERVASPEDVEAYLNEARVLAGLDHPHIVPVHDTGRTEDGLCFVVSKLIEGNDLRKRIKEGSMPFEESAQLVATIAEALHHAHRKGLVHRDVKPANILLDNTGKPYLADFGLVLREEDFGKGYQQAGTPVYMSPEQARGEGHRVDGRSDIFSLGIVFYELLTGRRPFRGDSVNELFEQIATTEARPPRQIDDSIPRELERICLKALAPRASERYTTAHDLAEDLRVWLTSLKPGVQSAPTQSTTEPAADASSATGPGSDTRPIRIVPKGLRSFDEGDADFFLDLLPGARDRDGLPESVRFWKTRIEQLDADRTFLVGLLCGPSGCGKSSLVKAGLLPRLAEHVIPIYIEATPRETETRLLRGLHRHCPALEGQHDLVECLTRIRRGQGLPRGKKVVLVLDQFEQWLHAHGHQENTELIRALRQCDGGRLQAVVLVRDDFWMAVMRFLRELEVHLVEGQNSAAVDLFDTRHARKVLAAFGTAFGILPEKADAVTSEQNRFLDDAVAGLAQEGKVISVRLALFAEMVKSKPWVPATLRAVGGTAGVGVTFLEETFSATSARPEHRLHQRAARNVLRALLPERGSEIKGHMRSRAELLEASEYTGKPRDFEELLRILDTELRLITPTDPEGSDEDSVDRSRLDPANQYYQLTHDYLVPSLRDWLTRKQKETRRGRAELRLADRASLWASKPERRYLPAWWEWLNIRLFTRKRDWTEPQRRMMNRAGRYHTLRALLLLVLLTALGWGIYEGQGHLTARSRVDALASADTAEVPRLVKELKPSRRWADSLLHKRLAQADPESRERLHLALALAPVDAGQVDYLHDQLLIAPPEVVPVIRDSLKPYQDAVSPRLWAVLYDADSSGARKLRAASALAAYQPDDKRWGKVRSSVVDQLVSENAMVFGHWTRALQPVGKALVPAMVEVFKDGERSESERRLVTSVLVDYAADQPEVLGDLLLIADAPSYAQFLPAFKKHRERAVKLMQATLDRKPQWSWEDPPLDASWSEPEPALVQQVERASGMIEERWGFCQRMSLKDFLAVSEGLRKSGYRPIRFRPYRGSEGVRVAAVWTRDGRESQIVHGQTSEEIGKMDQELRDKGLTAVDVAGYLDRDAVARTERYGGIWVRRANDQEDSRIYVGAPYARHKEVYGLLEKEGFTFQQTLQEFRGVDGEKNYCGVKTRAEGRGTWSWNQTPEEYGNKRYLDQVAWDIGVTSEGMSPGDRRKELSSLAVLWAGLAVDHHTTPSLPAAIHASYLGERMAELNRAEARYAAVWQPEPRRESKGLHGLSRKDHLDACRKLVLEGYRPFACSAALVGEVEGTASVWHRPTVPQQVREALAKLQGQAATTMLHLDHPEPIWPLLKHTPEPDVRSWIQARMQPLGIDPRLLVRRLKDEKDTSARRALIVSLGEFTGEQLPEEVRGPLVDRLLGWYRDDADPGIHGAIDWLLRHGKEGPAARPLDWGQAEALQKIDNELKRRDPEEERRWYVNGQGQTMVLVPGPVDFLMGSPATEPERFGNERLHLRRIPRSFAISSKPVTVAQWEQFLRERPDVRHIYTKKFSPDPEGPIISVTWFEAAQYCNWLSEKEGIPESEWCYPKHGDIKEGMKVYPDYLKRKGYRLPTEAEWEYACRAGTATSRYHGNTEELLPRYSWFIQNSQDRTWPAGQKRPNDLGLFDVHGNVWNWCQDPYLTYPTQEGDKPVIDQENTRDILSTTNRVLRGGSFTYQPSFVRSPLRSSLRPSNRFIFFGLRLARTYH